jgi:RNA polymerase sigma-70 factor (ECF subfamily)
MTGDDADLVRECVNGNRSAFEALLERYERPVYNLALRIVGQSDEARDVTQTVFLRAFEHLRSFDPRFRFFSWLYRIAVNESLDAAARRRGGGSPLLDTRPAPERGPEDRLQRAESVVAVRRAVAALPPDSRAVLVLRHYLDCGYKEMSEILGIPEKTVKSRLFTARERLRQVLAAGGVTGP